MGLLDLTWVHPPNNMKFTGNWHPSSHLAKTNVKEQETPPAVPCPPHVAGMKACQIHLLLEIPVSVPQKSALCLVKSQLFNGYTMLHPNCSTLTSHVWLNLAISSLHQHQLRRPAKGGRRASQVRPGKVGSFATHSVELDQGKTGELEEGPRAENRMPPTSLSASKFSPSGKQRHRRSERST